MLCRYIFVCVLLVTSAAVFLESNYGKYVTKVISYSVQNYKPFVKIAVDHVVSQNGSSTMIYHCVMLKDLGVFGIKVRLLSWNEALKTYTPGVNIVMRNICEKELAKEVLALFKGLGKDCKIKHGAYNITVVDMNEIMHIMMRDKFFYGKYRTITDVFTEKFGRIAKLNFTLGVEPI